MLSIQQVQQLAKAKPRTWRRATSEQRRQIAAEFERTGDVKQAFAGVSFNKVELSDLTFTGSRHGGGRYK